MRVARLLADGAERAERLLRLLETELESVEGADAQALLEATQAKQLLLAEFEPIGSSIAESLRGAGLEDGADVERWLRDHPSGPIAENLRRLRAALAGCQRANARNGAVVRLLARHNQTLLSLVQGEVPGAGVYGQDGRAHQGTTARYAARA